MRAPKCPHPVIFPLLGIRSLHFINQWKLYIFRKTLLSLFPDTALVIIPSTSKMVGGTTYILLTTCLTALMMKLVK